MTSTVLQTADAYPSDYGHSVARIGQEAFIHLQVSPGDTIVIDGQYTTAATAWRTDRVEWNTNTVRLDPLTRHNAGVDIGDPVTVRRAAPAPAESVWASPTSDLHPVDYDATNSKQIDTSLRQRPIVAGDLVPADGHPTDARAPDKQDEDDGSFLVIEATAPDGIVVIRDATALHISNCTNALTQQP
jgi:hypothetical protein